MVWPQAIGMRVIGIGRVHVSRLDEMLARHLVHGAQHRLVADAAAAQRQHELHPLYAFVVAARCRLVMLIWEKLCELGQKRLIGEIEPQRRHRDAVVEQRREIGAVLAGAACTPRA